MDSVSNFEAKIRSIQKKKKRNLVVKIISCCLVFLMLVVYFILPVSRVSNSKVNGNIHYTSEQILEIAGLNKKDSLYLISKDKIKENLKKAPLIDENEIDISITPLGLTIDVEEIVPILQYEEDIYMSDGKLLDEELLKSKDPLVGDYLFLHTKDLIPVYSKPFEEKFTSSRVEHLSKLILSLDEESRNRIKGVSYDSSTYYFSFYYETGIEDDTILKIVFDSAKKVEDLNVIIESEKIDQYISILNDPKTKDNFVSFTETIEGQDTQIKSIKIVTQTLGDEIYYHVKYNNPPSL